MPFSRFVLCLCCVLGLLTLGTATRAQEGYMGGFLVPEPLVPATDAAVRAMLPDEGAYNYVTSGGAFMAGPVRLTWQGGNDAYAFFYFPDEDPADVLYRPASLGEREVLWQSAAPFEAGGETFYEIFATYHFDGMVAPLYFAVEALAPLMAAHDVALLPAPETLGTANAPGMWLLQGQADDIRAVLAEAAADENATTFDLMLLPDQP